MEEEMEILEPYGLLYSDLISLSSIDNILESSSSSSSSSPSNNGEIERLEAISRAIMEALGPTGPGLLAVTDVPNAAHLRRTLLPLARDLAILSNDDRKRILKDHGLGSDVPLKNLDRSVSSFAMQLKYGDNLNSSNLSCERPDCLAKPCEREEKSTACANKKLMDSHFKDLGGSFRELGFCMMDLGLRLARICDRAIGGKELEESLLESGTAKGRLIHYHSTLDTCIIKESGRRKGSKKAQPNSKPERLNAMNGNNSDKGEKVQKNDEYGRSYQECSNLWQQWHYDYGTFTVLASPMFIRPQYDHSENLEGNRVKFCGSESPSPGGHTYLQILHPHKNSICIVKAPPESFILQVGESADILSKRKLQSTLHSVLRPISMGDLSRETFVVFLHPAWNKVFDITDYPMEQHEKKSQTAQDGIHKIIPPLSSRLKGGMTFAEFSRETTRRYYGGNGLQSNR